MDTKENHAASQFLSQFTHPIQANQTIGNKHSDSGLISLGLLSGILLLAAWLRLTNLSSLGLSNHYYAAAVKSMLQSWHNFLFVAAEPGGSVSVDKPPVGLWLQVISVRIFGMTTLGLLLPQLLAGLLSVILIYHLVKRRFGPPSGLLAALVLSITPVAVATDRNNTMDSTLVLTLLLAAWVFIKSTETKHLRFLILGSVIVGIAFNIKMLEAFLPLPALLLMYFLGAHESWWRKIGKLALASVVLLIISLSWAVFVDLTQTERRPYVGSSGDNSEISLILGYNGIDRLLGLFGHGRTDAAIGGNEPILLPSYDGVTPPGSLPPVLQYMPPENDFLPAGLIGGLTSGLGQAGPLRLFIPPLSKEAGWLLPIGVFSLILLVVSTPITLPVRSQHQAAILWGGWLIIAGIVFSIAGFFHEYYLTTMAPPLAALVGIGTIQIWKLASKRLWLSCVLWVIISSITLILQINTVFSFTSDLSWLPGVVGLFLLGTFFVIGANLFQSLPQSTLVQLGFSSILVAVLIVPGIWSELTNLHPTGNQSLPEAYDSRASGVYNYGLVQLDEQVLAYLQANTQGVYYLMAVPSSMQGADYIVATGRPVLYVGGFTGQDSVVTPEELESLLNAGKLRFFYWPSSPSGLGDGIAVTGQSLINTWVTGHCKVVPEYSTFLPGFPAVPGMNVIPHAVAPYQGQPNVLYDCSK